MLLQELRGDFSQGGQGPMPGTKLAAYEMKELTMRGFAGGTFEQGGVTMTAEGAVIDEAYLADRVGGLGTQL